MLWLACGSLVTAGVLATGGTGGTVAGAVFAACSSGGGQYLCDKTLPPAQRQEFTTAQAACKAGSAAACSLAADIICTPTNLVCSAPLSEACESALDVIVCEPKRDPTKPPEVSIPDDPRLCDPESQSCEPRRCNPNTQSCPVPFTPSPPPPPPPTECDPNTQSCPPPVCDSPNCMPPTGEGWKVNAFWEGVGSPSCCIYVIFAFNSQTEEDWCVEYPVPNSYYLYVDPDPYDNIPGQYVLHTIGWNNC